MKLGILAPYVTPVLRDTARENLEDLLAIARLAKQWDMRTDGRRTSGRWGPAWRQALSAKRSGA